MNTQNLTPTMNNANMAQNQDCPPWLPAKFWDEQNGEVRTEALARSYQELERNMGRPEQGLGADVPDSPSAYNITIDKDFLDIDEDVNQRLYQNGFSQSQAQLVYDLAAERLMPMVQDISAKYENAREEETLTKHFGGVERFQAIRPQLRAWGEANLKPVVFENLIASAEGVIAMYEMMKNKEPSLSRTTDMRPNSSETDLKRMMKDPRYWKDRDPGYVAQVREGFRALYPEKT